MEAQAQLLLCHHWKKVETSWRTTCCKILWCDSCLENITQGKSQLCCENCSFKAEVDPVIEKFMLVITKKCKDCGKEIILENFSTHIQECSKEIKCKIWSEKFRYSNLWDHVRKEHQKAFEDTFIFEESIVNEGNKQTKDDDNKPAEYLNEMTNDLGYKTYRSEK